MSTGVAAAARLTQEQRMRGPIIFLWGSSDVASDRKQCPRTRSSAPGDAHRLRCHPAVTSQEALLPPVVPPPPSTGNATETAAMIRPPKPPLPPKPPP